jgi:EAL domain-containing protein (putative c-di-GMP-specific phosphodiesterase class I)
MVPPGEFIGVAERRHLITAIGEWVVEQACAQMAQWRQVLGFAPRVALNTSIGQLVRPGLARTLLAAAAEHGLHPSALQLEITESQLLHADSDTLDNLLACRDVGCELAIDDFGTGHAGFDYLRKIPAAVLKVDKTFIDGLGADPTDAAIASSILALGHGLGMTVVAEGVEAQVQADALRGMGCDAAQGWLWHPALPPDDLLALLRGADMTG